ncbi:MAG: threonine synthase [Ignavibacteriales bacterium]|nr:threonine synthase [Ignavibacteriales bacterium]
MEHYLYKCYNCYKEYSSIWIEENFIYLCPSCGKAEKNQPLKGVLKIEYDYDGLKKKLNREKFLKLPAGQFWLYPDLWPVDFQSQTLNKNFLDRIRLTNDPFFELTYNGKSFSVFDDTRNPTLSFKDRASSLVAAKALQIGVKEIAAASTGNAGSSLAGICARLGLKSHIFVPENIPAGKRIQIQSFGANIYLVKGDYDQAFDLCLEIAAAKKWYNRNTAYNPLTIEGKKSAAYDIFISTQGNIPDIIFVPVGDGVIISGIYKGFRELFQLGWIEKIPKLIAVQSSVSNALVRYLKEKKFNYIPANTIADSISAGVPRNLFMAADAVEQSEGEGIEVTDEEILSAQKFVAQNYGMLIEPASAASFAGYKKYLLIKEETGKEKIMLMFTGNGLKDLNALNSWNEAPNILTAEEWKIKLNV